MSNYGNPSFSKAIYDCALECALRRQKHRCKECFDSVACSSCRFYVKDYIDAEPSQVKLFMMQAEMQADGMRLTNRTYWLVPLILASIIVLFYLGGKLKSFVYHKSLESPKQTVQVQQRVEQPSLVSSDDLIKQTLRQTAIDLIDQTDVNADGWINCIDASVLFYKYWPSRNDIKMMANYNERTGMNHLFIMLYLNSKWEAIEPQARWINQKSYLMQDIWGDKYDPQFNYDATARYTRYVR